MEPGIGKKHCIMATNSHAVAPCQTKLQMSNQTTKNAAKNATKNHNHSIEVTLIDAAHEHLSKTQQHFTGFIKAKKNHFNNLFTI